MTDIRLALDEGRYAAFKNERLDEMIPGMYVKEFVVFHGERLVYSIDEDKEGRSYVVESETLKTKSFNRKDRSRFEIIFFKFFFDKRNLGNDQPLVNFRTEGIFQKVLIFFADM